MATSSARKLTHSTNVLQTMNPIPTLIHYSITLLAWGYGVLGFIAMKDRFDERFDQFIEVVSNKELYSFFTENSRFLITLGLATVAGATLLALFIVFILSKIGAEFLNAVAYGVPVLILAVGVFLFVKDFYLPVTVAVLAVGGISLLIALILYQKIRLGAALLETSAEAVTANKKTILVALGYVIIFSITFVLGLGGAFYTTDLISENVGWKGRTLAVFLYFFVYGIINYSYLFYSDGLNIAIFYRWVRGDDHVSFLEGIREVQKVRGRVILLGVMFALLNAINKTLDYFVAKESKNTPWAKFNKLVAKILYWVLIVFVLLYKLLFWAFRTLNYYTLPVLVIEKRSLTGSVSRSADLAGKSLIDMFIGEVGVGLVSVIYMVFSFLFMAVAGLVTGHTYVYDELGGNQTWIALGTMVAFIIAGFIPIWIVQRPLRIAYKTLLFTWITDEETRDIIEKSRLTSKLVGNLDKALAKARKIEEERAKSAGMTVEELRNPYKTKKK